MVEENSISNNNSNEDISNLNVEDRIYEVAVNKEILDWKTFLYDLIYREGLNPWDIDLGILTKKYLIALEDLKNVDFNISGKFLTVAVYLLKTKSEKLLDVDLRGFEDEIQSIHNEENYDELEDFEDDLDGVEVQEEVQKEYKLKFRNPIARKRKVNIFDLIKTLEKTFEQSNKRRANFLQRKQDVNYDGPIYEKKKKDLNEIIEDLFELIQNHFNEKNTTYILFDHVLENKEDKLEVINNFLPLLYLHNQSRVELKQEEHFKEIEIHRIND